MKYARILEMLLGVVFIFSAAAKALDMTTFAVQVSYYGLVREPSLVRMVAWTMLGVESLLGAGLIAGFRLRGGTLAATAALLVGFSGMIAYAWVYQGLEDCGCFGKYIPMGPRSSLLKNIVLLAMTGAAWYGTKRPALDGEGVPVGSSSGRRRFFGVAGLAVVAGAVLVGWGKAEPPAVTSTEEGPFAKYTFVDGEQTLSLKNGEFVVAVLSATCEHCQAAAELLNELAAVPDVPKVVALVMGDEMEMEEFESVVRPAYPMSVFGDPLDFFNLIGKEPPRFYLVKDGAEVRHLDVLDPALDDLKAFAAGTPAVAPAS
ncbi:MAG: hypothetical protein IT365_12490 [Candidatus Hydrogenedentes bacterium]|nr:hypothetical protein [Candidatus Hydrogenedentota bacterium]